MVSQTFPKQNGEFQLIADLYEDGDDFEIMSNRKWRFMRFL